METLSYVSQRKSTLNELLPRIKVYKGTHALVVAVMYWFLFVLYFSPILFSGNLLLADGIIPADTKIESWSDYIFSGYPLIADPVWGKFYPIKPLIYRILGLDFNYLIIFGYFLMAYFTYGYVYCLTRLKSASFISGLLFSFSGYAIFEIGHAINFIHTLCWLPLVLLGFERLKNDYSFWGMSGVVFGSAMTILGGFPQLSFMLLLIFLSYPFLLLYFQSEKKYKNALMQLVFVGMGYLLVAPVIISTFVLSLNSDRTHLTWEAFSTYYVEFKQLLLFNFPYLMGGYYGIYSKIPGFGNWELIGNHGFMGFASLLLAGLAVYKCKQSMRLYVNYWFFFGILSVIVALGPEVEFFYKFLFQIPIVNNFRAPERYLFLFSFSISILASIGIQTMFTSLIQSVRQKRWILGFAVFFSAVLIISVITIYPQLNALSLQRNHVSLPFWYKNVSVLIPCLWIFLSLAVFYFWLRCPSSRLRGISLLIILCGEILSSAYFSYWHPSHSLWNKEELNHPPVYLTELRDDLNKSRQRYLTMRLNFNEVGKCLWGNMPIYYQIPSANGVLPLAIVRYYELLQIETNGTYSGVPEMFEENQAINITGIKYLMTTKTEQSNSIWFKNTERFKLRKEFGELQIYENLNALPRAWFTGKVVSLPEKEVFKVITSSKFSNGEDFLPAKTALIEVKSDINIEQDETATAVIVESKGSKVVINTQTEKPQFLILSDVYFPGWKAYIDGKETEIFLTDYIYRGVLVPEGTHIITYEFRPWYLYLGYTIFALTLLSLLIFAFRQSRP